MLLFNEKYPLIINKNKLIFDKKLLNVNVTSVEGPLKNADNKWIMKWSREEQTNEAVIKILSKQKIQERYIIELDYGLFLREISCVKTGLKQEKLVDVFIAAPGNCFLIGDVAYRVSKHTVKEKAVYDANDKIQLFKLRDFKSKAIKPQKFNSYLCYDVETCADKNNEHKVYLAYVNRYNENFEFQESRRFCFDKKYDTTFYDDDAKFEFYDFTWDFGAWIRDTYIDKVDFENGVEHVVCLFGFNNARFDNHFIYDYFVNTFDMQYNERFGKVTAAIFKYNHVNIYLNDLVSWLPEKGLNDALEEYECGAKDDIAIVTFNNLFKDKGYSIEQVRNATLTEFDSCIKKEVSFLSKRKLRSKYKNENDTYNLFQAVDDYCLQDVNATWLLYTKIQENFKKMIACFESSEMFSENIYNYISPSHASGVLLNNHLGKTGYRLSFTNESFFNFVNDSFFGGRVDFGCIGEYLVDDKIACLDVTSMYSLAMTANFPIIEVAEDVQISCLAEMSHVEFAHLIQQKVDHGNCLKQLWIARCEITLPEDKTKLCSFGPLPERYNGKLEFPNKTFESKIITSVHAYTAMLCGYTIRILPDPYNLYFKKSAPCLKDLVMEIIRLKAEAKEDNKALGKLLKLFANSFHGKLAQKVIAKYHETRRYVNKTINNRFESMTISQSRIYLATFVTSFANLILMQAFLTIEGNYIQDKISVEDRAGTLLYCDTDSIFFRLKDEQILTKFTISESLGSFNPETNTFDSTWSRKYNRANGIMIMGKKSYFVMETKNDKVTMLDLKLKGVHRGEMEQFTRQVVVDKIIKPFVAGFDSQGISIERKTLKRKLLQPTNVVEDNDGEQISFVGLERRANVFHSYEGNSSQSFVKSIYETILKKTLRVNVSDMKQVLKKVDDKLIFYLS